METNTFFSTFVIDNLVDFLIEAKRNTYASGGREIEPERPGFKELEFKDDLWYYRDSYAGFFSAPGQEVVRYNGIPVWAMAYNGGMRRKYRNVDYAKQVFNFLKKALMKVEKERPFRGPGRFEGENLVYIDESFGDVREFRGRERILDNGFEVFSQDYIGGLILTKEGDIWSSGGIENG